MSQVQFSQGASDLQSFIDSLDDALVIIGAGFRILQVNAAAVRLTGHPNAGLIGQPCYSCYSVLHGRSATWKG